MSTFVAILVSVKAQSNSDTAEWWGDHHGEFGLNTVGLGAVAPSSVNPTVEYFYDHLDQKDVSNEMPVSMRKLTKPHLLGSDGHGLPPRHKAHLLGSDGHGRPPAYLSQHDGEDNVKPQLLGANGHGLPPRHKAHLLGSDGHGLPPAYLSQTEGDEVQLLGANGHGLPPRHKAQLLGSDGHGLPPAFLSQPTVVPTVNPTVEYFYDHLDQNDGQQQVIPADQELQKLGAGGHGQQTIPAIQLIPAHNLGANGHGLPPAYLSQYDGEDDVDNVKPQLLGSDGQGLPPAYLSQYDGEDEVDNVKPQLLGANGHGLPPRHKAHLLGSDGHGLPPAQFVGKDGRVHHVMRAYEVQAPDHEAHLLGANGHGLPRQRLTSKVAEGEDEEAMMLPFINLLPSTGVSGGQGVIKKAENNGDDIDDEGPEGSMGDQQQQLMVGGVWRRLRGSFVE